MNDPFLLNQLLALFHSQFDMILKCKSKNNPEIFYKILSILWCNPRTSLVTLESGVCKIYAND